MRNLILLAALLTAACLPRDANAKDALFGLGLGVDLTVIAAGVALPIKFAFEEERPAAGWLAAGYTLGVLNVGAGGTFAVLGVYACSAFEPNASVFLCGIPGLLQFGIGLWDLIATNRAHRLPAENSSSIAYGPIQVVPFAATDGRRTVAGLAGWF